MPAGRLPALSEIALKCRRIDNACGAIELTLGCRSEPRPKSRPTDLLLNENPEASRMTELAQVPESDNFYEAFLAPMKSRMLRAVWRIIRDPDLVEDTVQDALTVIWRRRERIRLHPNPQALILRIAINVSYDVLRRSIRLRSREQQAEEAKAVVSLPGITAPPMESNHVKEAIRAALARLPRKQAVAVLLRLVHGEPYESVAQVLGCSEPTARIHVMRGRARLRRLLSRPAGAFRGREGDER